MRLELVVVLVGLVVLPAAQAAATATAAPATWDGILAVHVDAQKPLRSLQLTVAGATTTAAATGLGSWIHSQVADGELDWRLGVVYQDNTTDQLQGSTYSHNLLAAMALQLLPLQLASQNASLQAASLVGPVRDATAAAKGAQGAAGEARDAAQAIRVPTDYASQKDVQGVSQALQGNSSQLTGIQGNAGLIAVLLVLVLGMAALAFRVYRRQQPMDGPLRALIWAIARRLKITDAEFREANLQLNLVDAKPEEQAPLEGPSVLVTVKPKVAGQNGVAMRRSPRVNS